MQILKLLLLSFSFLCTAAAVDLPRKPFYCMRHGLTSWNLLLKSQGQTDIPLHSLGKQQAEYLRRACEKLPITHFYTSPLSRAYETMKMLNTSLQLPEYIHDGLIERSMGSLEGVTAKVWYTLDKTLIDAQLENKEIFEARTAQALNDILSIPGTPFIVAHSQTIRVIEQLVGCSVKHISGVVLYFEPQEDDTWKITLLSGDNDYAPVGKLIDVNGIKLHMYETGQSNKPTVVFDAGLGGNVFEWISIQEQIAPYAHTVSYDRAGLGWSEESLQPRICSYMVEELRTLLRNAGIKPPYILVGHSAGGVTMRYFANKYPNEVCGLVLVDSSHEQQIKKINALKDLYKPTHNSSDQLNLSWLPDGLHDIYKALENRAEVTIEREMMDRVQSFKELAVLTNKLRNKPVTVITRGTKVVDNASEDSKSYEQALHDLWLEFQQNLVSKSKYGKQVIAHNTGHMIHRESPEVVIDAIKEMIELVNKK